MCIVGTYVGIRMLPVRHGLSRGRILRFTATSNPPFPFLPLQFWFSYLLPPPARVRARKRRYVRTKMAQKDGVDPLPPSTTQDQEEKVFPEIIQSTSSLTSLSPPPQRGGSLTHPYSSYPSFPLKLLLSPSHIKKQVFFMKHVTVFFLSPLRKGKAVITATANAQSRRTGDPIQEGVVSLA